MHISDYLAVAENYVHEHHKDAECAFVAGSIMRGEGTKHSDIDLVVMYGPDFNAVRRESTFYKGVPFEVFIMNEEAQDYFF